MTIGDVHSPQKKKQTARSKSVESRGRSKGSKGSAGAGSATDAGGAGAGAGADVKLPMRPEELPYKIDMGYNYRTDADGDVEREVIDFPLHDVLAEGEHSATNATSNYFYTGGDMSKGTNTSSTFDAEERRFLREHGLPARRMPDLNNFVEDEIQRMTSQVARERQEMKPDPITGEE